VIDSGEFRKSAAGLHAARHGGRYGSEDVSRWLGVLAKFLKLQQQLGGSGVDLHPATLWLAAGYRKIRAIEIALKGTLMLSLLLVFGYLGLPDHGDAADGVAFMSKVIAIPCAVLFAYLSFESRFTLHVQTARYHCELPTWRSWLVLFVSFVAPIAMALAIGLSVAIVTDGYIGTYFARLGFLIAVCACVAGDRDLEPSHIARPSEPVHNGVLSMILLLASTLGLGILSWGLSLRNGYPAFGPATVLWFIYAALIGCMAMNGPSLRYLLAMMILARERQLPFRLSTFLDWCHEAGILRLAGSAVQFRHRELQDYFEGSVSDSA